MAYAWGDPEDSRLGGVDVRQHHKPQPIKALTQMLRRLRFKIASAQDPHEQTIIACGVSHNLILTTAGRLLAWGCGRYGQLGYGDKIHRGGGYTWTPFWEGFRQWKQ